jgi:hypothetical protein
MPSTGTVGLATWLAEKPAITGMLENELPEGNIASTIATFDQQDPIGGAPRDRSGKYRGFV